MRWSPVLATLALVACGAHASIVHVAVEPERATESSDAVVIEEASREAGIVVTDEDVARAIASVPPLVGTPPYVSTPRERAQIRAYLLRFRLLDALMGPRVLVTDDEVRGRYDDLCESRSAPAPSFESVRDTLRAQIRMGRLEALYPEMIRELRARRRAGQPLVAR